MDLENVKDINTESFTVQHADRSSSFLFLHILKYLCMCPMGRMMKCLRTGFVEESMKGERVVHPMGLVTIDHYQKFRKGQLIANHVT